MTDQVAGQIVLTQDVGRVRILTMNRPERLNAFNQELFAGLGDALVAAAGSGDVHVVVLTGAGRAFSSGADLGDMGQARANRDDRPAGEAADSPFDRLQQAAESFPKPLVAAVNGVGVGLGFTILGYCDFTFVAQSARLRTPFTQLGLSPEASSSFLFPLRMGWQNAAAALIAGEWFDAQRAVSCGLALKVCPDAEVLDTAVAFAVELASGPLQSLTATKRLMLAAYTDLVAQARQRERESLARLAGTQANLDAIQAFAVRSRRD
jgi:enoyl-CoA hydratase/carnithine racemase